MIRYVAILMVLTFASLASADRCPLCGKDHSLNRRVETAQAFAEREDALMVKQGRMGHLLGVAPGCRFAGVGYSTSPNPPTCTPSRPMTLVADAIAYCPRTRRYYRSRHWR